MHGRGHAWQGVCMAGGVHCRGACMAGGMHGRGHAWRGPCMARGHVWQILRDMVNERAVRILLECILVKDDNTTNKQLLQLKHLTVVAVNSPTVDVIGPVVNPSL